MMSKVTSNWNYSVIHIPGPQSDALCSPLALSPNVFSLHHHLHCKSISPAAVVTCFQGRWILTWPEVSIGRCEDKAKLSFLWWSCSLSQNRKHNIRQQPPWPHVSWDQSNLSWFWPSPWHLVYQFLSSFHNRWKMILSSRELGPASEDVHIRCIGLSYSNVCVSPWPVVGMSV